MRTRATIWILLFLFVTLCVTDNAHAFGSQLKLEEIGKEEIKGTFSLILYGSRHSNDIETIAVLDREGDHYTFEPYAPAYDYKLMNSMSAKEAVKEAKMFVSWHHSYLRTEISRIVDKEGATVGYELRPLYFPLTFGYLDVMDVNYVMEGEKVTIYIQLKPAVERQLFDDGSEGWIWGD